MIFKYCEQAAVINSGLRYFPTVSLHFESQLPETFPFGLLSEAAAMLWALGGLKFFFYRKLQ